MTYAAVDDLKEYLESLEGPGWLSDIRKEAGASFERSEWPTTSEEEWRRTSLRAFEFGDYETGPAANGHTVSHDDELKEVAGRLGFADDHLSHSSLRADLQARGVVFSTVLTIESDPSSFGPHAAAALDAARESVRSTLQRADNRMILWHHSLVADPAIVYVPRGVEFDAPLCIDYVVSGDSVVRAPHTIVVVEDGASASVVVRLRSDSDGEVLVLDMVDLRVGANAGLSLAQIQRVNDESIVFSNGRTSVAADGRIHRTEAQLGGDFVKGRFEASLEGKGADAALDGIYFARDEQHMDLRTIQGHSAPRTSSRAFYRGAVRDECHTVYQGLIAVTPEARGTDAYLTNKNLILSEDARADSIPSLNIATDDVKCSHGSTTGKIDESQVFYLQTRGYTEDEARLLLIEGYFEDLISVTHVSLQDELRDLVQARLADEDDD